MITPASFAAPKRSPESYRRAWQRHAQDMFRPSSLARSGEHLFALGDSR